jgi:hypothetical protein
VVGRFVAALALLAGRLLVVLHAVVQPRMLASVSVMSTRGAYSYFLSSLRRKLAGVASSSRV